MSPHIKFLLVFLLASQIIHAQQKTIDSLQNLVLNTSSDTTRVLAMIDLAGIYQFNLSDSALALTTAGKILAQKIGYRRGELRAITRQGEVHHLRGEYPQALEAELTAIRLSREYNYPDVEAECLTFVATIYIDLTDYDQAKQYLFQAKHIYDKINVLSLVGGARQLPPFTLSNIGLVYEKMNLFDSAMHFYQLALDYRKNYDPTYPINFDYQQITDVLNRMGMVKIRTKNYEEAKNYCKEAIKISQLSDDLLNRSVSYYQLAMIFRDQNILDSAMHYALQAYSTSNKSSYKLTLLDADILLSELHNNNGNYDSALYYQQRAMNIKDNLFGIEKFRKLELLALSDQQRVQQLREDQVRTKTQMQQLGLLIFVAIALIIAYVLWRSNRVQKKNNKLLFEKNQLIEKRSEELKKTLAELKSTQSQLIQSEKMASLGELTAGIAHEIQNPLNFVNNFSEVSTELVSELNTEIDKGNTVDAKDIATDLKQNLEKINHHGKRAADIVKGMLQHSRASSGQKELTDINVLADEYLRLTYHGLRAKDKSFNAKFETHLDPALPKLNVIPQDIGRVLLNLINNAFYACTERSRSAVTLRHSKGDATYQPTVWVSTINLGDKIEISVKDNGNGIPDSIKEKIFQPFFTTKPTGQGTGLGLSLSYDIIKAHGGALKVETKVNEGSLFSIQLPITIDK